MTDFLATPIVNAWKAANPESDARLLVIHSGTRRVLGAGADTRKALKSADHTIRAENIHFEEGFAPVVVDVLDPDPEPVTIDLSHALIKVCLAL